MRHPIFRALLSLLVLSALLALGTIPVFAQTPPELSNMRAAYLYNIENDAVLYELNPDEQIFPASTVKIMTGILATEELGERLEEKITITENMLDGVTGNSINLLAGEVVTVQDLLYALLVGCANDAASVLAHVVSGSIEAFLTRMNEKASSLGASHTYYKNPSGLHDGDMVTTLSDTAKIALYAYRNDLFMEICSTSKYVMQETNLSEFRTIYNRNYMIAKNKEVKYYYPDAMGINAGSTAQAGMCVVTTACRDDLTYLCIVMGAEEDEENNIIYSYQNAIDLLDYAFESYAYREVLSTNRVMTELPVSLSNDYDHVALIPANPLSVYLPVDADLETDIKYSYKTNVESLDAPVEKGQVVGSVTVSYRDELLGTVDLITVSSIERSQFFFFLQQLRNFTTSRFFILAVVFFVLFALAYVLLQAVIRGKRSRRGPHFR